DLRTVLTWFHTEMKQRVIVLGISIGGTMALQAVQHESDCVKAVIVVSPDSNTNESDRAADAFFQNEARTGNRRFARPIAKLPKPPYIELAAFQQRARLLADLGTIEYGRTFGALLTEMLVAMIRTYGISGTIKALRNMNAILSRLLPQIVPLDLFADPPRI